jgi:phosphoglycolate phosphatase
MVKIYFFMKKKIELFIFDLDGTLIDSRKDLANAVNYARKQYNLDELDIMTVASFIGHGVKNLIAKTFPGLEPKEQDKALEIFKKYYEEHCVDETTVYEGVKDMLKYFESKAMAIVSNKPYPFTKIILKKINLDSYFKLVLGEESHPKKKPDPAPLLYVAEKLGIKPTLSCMVGDWITDVEAGKRAGMVTVGCLYGIGNQRELREFKPDYLVDSILELKDLFE